jgi:hypothetical protein
MTKNLLIALGIFLITSPLASAEITKNVSHGLTGDITTYRVKIDGIQPAEIAKVGPAQLIELKLNGVDGHEGVQYRVGYPELPVVRFLVDGQVQVQAANVSMTRRLNAGQVMRPSLESVVKRPNAKAAYEFNQAAYLNHGYSPAVPYSLQNAGSKMGMPQTLVTLYPVAYRASTGELAYRTDFIVKTFESTMVLQAKRESLAAKPLFAFIVGAAYVNSPSLAKYVTFKQSQGFDTVIGVVGKDFKTDNDIRAWLQARLKSNLKYALLVGSAKDVPSHSSDTIHGMTDHYYRAIDTANYDADINGPDIGVGRVSVLNEKELNNVVEKFIRYTTNSFKSRAWYGKASFLATNDRYEVAEGTHNYVINTYTAKLGYSGSFPQAPAAGGDKLYAITNKARTSNVAAALNEGRAIVNYSGHGSEVEWAGPSFMESDVASIKSEALPFVISNACDTGYFGQSTPSFGETWLRQPTAAIAFWGSFVSTYWDEDDILERRMFDGIFKDGKSTLSDITENAMKGLWTQYGGAGKSKYYWETYVLYGDPSIALHLVNSGH